MRAEAICTSQGHGTQKPPWVIELRLNTLEAGAPSLTMWFLALPRQPQKKPKMKQGRGYGGPNQCLLSNSQTQSPPQGGSSGRASSRRGCRTEKDQTGQVGSGRGARKERPPGRATPGGALGTRTLLGQHPKCHTSRTRSNGPEILDKPHCSVGANWTGRRAGAGQSRAGEAQTLPPKSSAPPDPDTPSYSSAATSSSSQKRLWNRAQGCRAAHALRKGTRRPERTCGIFPVPLRGQITG